MTAELAVDITILLAWTLLSLLTAIILSLLYSIVKRVSKGERKLRKLVQSSINQESPTFFSPSVDRAWLALASSEEAASDYRLEEALDLSIEALTMILSQSLNQHGLEPSLLNLTDMANLLVSKGSDAHLVEAVNKIDNLKLKSHSKQGLTQYEVKQAASIARGILSFIEKTVKT